MNYKVHFYILDFLYEKIINFVNEHIACKRNNITDYDNHNKSAIVEQWNICQLMRPQSKFNINQREIMIVHNVL